MPTFSTNHSFTELNILKNKYFYIEISYLFLLHLPACVLFAFARTNKDLYGLFQILFSPLHLPACVLFAFARTNKDLYDLAYILFFHKKLVNNSFDGIVKNIYS